jgi:ABC-2 type transport system ATP-binding protein
MLQRIGLAQALINDPELIVLDEPTDGLDPMGRRDVRALLQEYKAQGKTVFINSHLLSELEMVCDRVSILVGGWVARQGRLQELTEQSQEYRIAVDGDVSHLLEGIADLGGELRAGAVLIPGHDRQIVNRMIDLLRSSGVLIESVEPRRFSLEEVFVETLGGSGRGGIPVGPDRTGRGAN